MDRQGPCACANVGRAESPRHERGAELIGRYAAAGSDPISVTGSSDGLRLRVGAGLEFDLFQVTADGFYVPGLDYFIGFSGVAASRRMHVRSMFADFVATPVTRDTLLR